jgi:aminopeptidase YwaD
MNEMKAAYSLQAMQRGVAASEPVMSAEEKEASMLMVELPSSGAAPVGPPAGGRGGAAPAGGGGRGVGGAGGPQLPDEFSAELGLLLRKGGMSALQVRDFLSGEFTPLPMADVMAVLKAREASGSIRLVPKAVKK